MSSETLNGRALDTVSVFERMLSQEERDAFLAYRIDRRDLDPRGFEDLSAYVNSDDCTADIERILAHDFELPLPRRVFVRKANTNRRRTLFIYPLRQNLLFKYLTWELHEYDDIFQDNLYSFRMGRRVADFFRKVESLDFARGLWVMKADVTDYFYSIKPHHLIPMLDHYMGSRDPLLFSFLKYLLTNNTYLRDDEVVHGYMGGLQGVPMAMVFGNTYLMELDEAMINNSVLSMRYSDDVAVFVKTREEALAAHDKAQEILDKLEISFNQKKTSILAPGDSVEMLGIQLRDNNFDIADNTIAKAEYKLKRFAHKLVLREQRGEISREKAAQVMVNRTNRYFYGAKDTDHKLNWRTYFFDTVTRPDSLRVLDHYVQNLIRYVATGKRTNSKYRMTYQAMRDLGYVPLVHEYYQYRKEMYLRHESMISAN